MEIISVFVVTCQVMKSIVVVVNKHVSTNVNTAVNLTCTIVKNILIVTMQRPYVIVAIKNHVMKLVMFAINQI